MNDISSPGGLTERNRLTLRARRRRPLESRAVPASSIPRRSHDRPCLPSFAQERLIFLEKLNPGTTVYNLPEAVRLEGQLDFETLERTFAEIIQRHEALRTTFAFINGQFVQRIKSAHQFQLKLIDLTSSRDADGEVDLIARLDIDRPFDLENGPLLRARLVRLTATEHVLLFTFHHIIFDGWSRDIVVRELSVLYPAFRDGLPSPLAPLPIQYADFANWQRETLTEERVADLLRYWRHQLRPLSPLQLPADHQRSEVLTQFRLMRVCQNLDFF